MLYGSYFGPAVLLSGFVQGLGSEAGFIVTRYRRYDTMSLLLAAVGTTLFSFTYEYFKLGYGAYSFGMILGLVTVRLLSVIFFGVVLVQLVMKLYEQAAGVKRLAGR